MSPLGVRRAAVPVAIAVAVLALVLGVLAAAGTFDGSSDAGPGSGEQPPPDGAGGGTADGLQSRFTSIEPSADGRTLTVTFWGGVEECYRYQVLVKEAPDAVTLTLREELRDGVTVCIELAQEHTRTVELARPLGTRQITPTPRADHAEVGLGRHPRRSGPTPASSIMQDRASGGAPGMRRQDNAAASTGRRRLQWRQASGLVFCMISTR